MVSSGGIGSTCPAGAEMIGPRTGRATDGCVERTLPEAPVSQPVAHLFPTFYDAFAADACANSSLITSWRASLRARCRVRLVAWVLSGSGETMPVHPAEADGTAVQGVFHRGDDLVDRHFAIAVEIARTALRGRATTTDGTNVVVHSLRSPQRRLSSSVTS